MVVVVWSGEPVLPLRNPAGGRWNFFTHPRPFPPPLHVSLSRVIKQPLYPPSVTVVKRKSGETDDDIMEPPFSQSLNSE